MSPTGTPSNRPRHTGRRRTVTVAAVVLALVAALFPALGGSAAAQTVAPPSLDMKLLLISADGQETDFPAWKAFLDQVGMPYDTFIGTQGDLTASMLSSSPTSGKYQGIVLMTGNLVYFDQGSGTYPSGLTADEFATLRAYQSAFGVRSITSFTYPEAAYGMTYRSELDTLGSSLGASLTAAGRTVWPYVNEANAISLTGAYVYLGDVIDPNVTTPLLTATVAGRTHPIVSVTQYTGYENMASTVANNPFLMHSLLLSTGSINWLTKGVWLGNRTSNMDVQIDDLFIADDVWDPATNTVSGSYRNTATDIKTLATYTTTRRKDAVTPAFRMEWAFNGTGAGSSRESLTASVISNRSMFGFINHTFNHFNLDCGDCPDPTGVITTNATQIRSEIKQNRDLATKLGLPGDADTMVQPDISGINTPPNPMAQQASGDEGIRYWIGDTSRPGLGNPSFNVGFATAGDPRVYVVPRHSNNLFVAASTPDQWVGVYNYFYAPGGVLCGSPTTTCFDRAQTYAEILDHESDYLVRYLIRGDFNPWMFHIANARTYQTGRTLLTDLIDATLTKYKSLVKNPIQNLSHKQSGQAMQDRGAYNAAGVTASLTPCQSITLTATNAATVPVNGVNYKATNSTVQTYGGRTISNVRLTAGQTVTIPLPPCGPIVTCPSPQNILAVADATVDQSQASKNLGTASTLSVRGTRDGVRRSLVKFQLPVLPAGCKVTSASLNLRTATLKSGLTYQVQRASAAWTERGVTWSNQPGATGPITTAQTAKDWVTWDVTDQVAQSYPSDYGLIVRDANEGSNSSENLYSSRETNNQPSLDLTFGPA